MVSHFPPSLVLTDTINSFSIISPSVTLILSPCLVGKSISLKYLTATVSILLILFLFLFISFDTNQTIINMKANAITILINRLNQFIFFSSSITKTSLWNYIASMNNIIKNIIMRMIISTICRASVLISFTSLIILLSSIQYLP